MKKVVPIAAFVLMLWASLVFCGEQGFIKPTPKDKCPVCGMFVAKYPDWVAEIVFKDGSYAVFDGAKDLFRYYFNIKRYHPSRRTDDIVSIFFMDYYGLTPIDGFEASFVVGSDVLGPMGRELIPFLKEDDAKTFLKDHRGKSVLRFKDITPALVKGLD